VAADEEAAELVVAADDEAVVATALEALVAVVGGVDQLPHAANGAATTIPINVALVYIESMRPHFPQLLASPCGV